MNTLDQFSDIVSATDWSQVYSSFCSMLFTGSGRVREVGTTGPGAAGGTDTDAGGQDNGSGTSGGTGTTGETPGDESTGPVGTGSRGTGQIGIFRFFNRQKRGVGATGLRKAGGTVTNPGWTPERGATTDAGTPEGRATTDGTGKTGEGAGNGGTVSLPSADGGTGRTGDFRSFAASLWRMRGTPVTFPLAPSLEFDGLGIS